MRRWSVVLSKRAQRDVRRAPKRILEFLQEWVTAVETEGMLNVRRVPGYHDEQLSGDRKGQRSVRLNRQWRAIYTESATGELTLVCIEEVTPHVY